MAGLTAAIAFAARGHSVRVFERAPQLEEIGAGLQLSPNATKILDTLGVLEMVRPASVRPEAIVLRGAYGLKEITRVALGDFAEKRWGAPYLTVHRADLQSALASRLKRMAGVELITGADVRDVAFHPKGATLSIDHGGRILEATGDLVVAADGVWSTLRGDEGNRQSFTGLTAWRATIRRGEPHGFSEGMIAGDVVTAYLNPRFHLVAYPIRGGAAVNLVAITKGARIAPSWSAMADSGELVKALAATPGLAKLAEGAGSWTKWPLHVVDRRGPWTSARGIALIGDAAHAMTPFAAQGAAMAIEDAAVLAMLVDRHGDDLPAALAAYERQRRPRIARVARRGAFNRFTWHAAGPIAIGRNVVAGMLSPRRHATDLDWLYGWDASTAE
ncbi:salicylate hydroxylase [Aquibium oceanicum]|uniref:Salicylate hydroxylase n=2 Tax=Aquibium oceanicum TaxID=1670800 RepID=A0A1L3SZ07_9HYPH|nr:FAD-dependent monooxygenase [Aquibium oceanicum]APH74659.1 salicylate hydroxylase [Aquibium oceanicum]